MYILLRVYLGTELAVGRVGLNQLLRLGNGSPPSPQGRWKKGMKIKGGWMSPPPWLLGWLQHWCRNKMLEETKVKS
jgi:hypothetical protein